MPSESEYLIDPRFQATSIRNHSRKVNEMLHFSVKAAMCGALMGMLLGVFAGGLSSALLGQPFSGETGREVFHLGMFFPGLVIFAPVTTGIGAILGFIAFGFNRSEDKEE
jgi:hypothetical protein